MKYSFIFDATSACRARLRECVDSPALMVDEWPRKRLADLNLWASDSGALAEQRASLDQRLADSDKQAVHKVILNLLGLLESLLLRCQKLGKCCDFRGHFLALTTMPGSKNHGKKGDVTNLASTFQDVENILVQLAKISAAIRRAGTRARLERADTSFQPERHVELKQHLELLVSLGLLEEGWKFEPDNFFVPAAHFSDAAQRLIMANLLRRHRFLYARRRWGKQAAERETIAAPPMDKRNLLFPLKPQMPPIFKRILGSPTFTSKNTASGPQATTPVMGATSVITSTIPTTVQGPIQIPQGSRVSTVAPSSTTSKVVYPEPPKTEEGAMFFRCPCCYQTLSITFKNRFRWR